MTPTVYAQADLDALQRVGDPGLSAIATNGAARHRRPDPRRPASMRGATLVGDGPLTGPAVQLLGRAGPDGGDRRAPVSPRRTRRRRARHRRPRPRRYTPEVVAAPFDPTVGAALAGAGTTPSSPSYLDAALRCPAAARLRRSRAAQDALGALLWRGLRPDAEPRTQILMPPLAWDLHADDAAGDPDRGGHLDPRRAWRCRGR